MHLDRRVDTLIMWRSWPETIVNVKPSNMQTTDPAKLALEALVAHLTDRTDPATCGGSL